MNNYTIDSVDLPRQKVSQKIKNSTKWKHDCVDAIINNTMFKESVRRRTISEKQRDYDLFNNKIDTTHFQHVTNPYNLSTDNNSFQLPATLQPYDVLFPIFNILFADESKRRFNPLVRAINEDAISDKDKQLQGAVLQFLSGMFQNPETPDQPLEVVLKNKLNSIKDTREIQASHLLKYYKQNVKLADLTAIGWKDWLLAGETFFSIDSYANKLRCRRVNPNQLFFTLNENSSMIDDADQILEVQYATVNEIIDEYYEHLSSDQIDELENYHNNLGFYNGKYSLGEVASIYDFSSRESTIDKIRVYKGRWKTFREMAYFYYIDPQTGQQNKELVDASFKYDKSNPDQYMEYFWINEYWEFTRIGETMYIDDLIRRRENQFRSLDNISLCKSGYVGELCSALNSKSVSLMSRLVPWVYLYFIIWYDTELALSTNLGKIALIDVSMIPDGWEIEKWMYYARAMRIGVVNSLNEGNKRFGINQNMSTNNKELNLEMGNYIQFNIQLLQELERRIQNTAGVPPQRLGAISSQELVGNVDRSITQSSLVNEDLSRIYENVKLRVCDCIIEVGKDLLKSGSKALQYVTDDADLALFTVEGELINNADYATYLTLSVQDMEVMNMFKENIKFALQNDQMAFYQLAEIYSSDSVSKVRNSLKLYYEERVQREQDNIKAEQEAVQQKLANDQANFDKELAMKQYIADTNNETKIVTAEIGVYARQQELDQDNNGIIDPVEIANQALKARELDSKDFIERMKLAKEKIEKSRESSLKEKEINSKESIEKEKLKVAKDNMKNDLQIAKINARNKNK